MDYVGISRLLFLALLFCHACKTKNNSIGNSIQTIDTLLLVKTHCGRCHASPDPSALDRNTWNQIVLKNMGCRLGVQTPGYDPLSSSNMMEQTLLIEANIYPKAPLIAQEGWEKILAYYLNHAPDSLSVTRDSSQNIKLFEPRSKGELIENPTVTMLSFDTLSHEILVGLESGRIYTFSNIWKLKQEIYIGSTPIQYIPGSGPSYILSIGLLYPSEQKSGSVLQITKSQWVPVLNGLHRPVWMTLNDMNRDKSPDFIISEFGYETGQLAWYPGMPIKTKENILFGGPGSIKTFMADVNSDGKEEIVALIAQGNEHVSAYLNDENGKWEEKKLLSFPAVYGVCDMDLADFNRDHLVDIVISNGDNADYSQVNKPYHGIHIFINKGEYIFEESGFIPYPGVLHSEISDFDQDGDLDIAAVSFFPGDRSNPYPAFKYFENVKPFQWSSQTFKASNKGKWMNLIQGDFDEDGDTDLLLGSFILNSNMVTGTREELKSNSLLFLENKLF